MKTELFATPIWTYEFENAEEINKELLRVGPSFQFGKEYFNIKSWAVDELRERVMAYVSKIAAEYKWYDEPTLIHGRQHPLAPNECDTPHFHPFAKLIAVYYVQVPENSGDILFLDPRGGTFWPDPKAVTNEYRMARVYHRVTPKPGLLVMFPNYLAHSVETNLSNDWRISIPMEIFDLPKMFLTTA